MNVPAQPRPGVSPPPSAAPVDKVRLWKWLTLAGAVLITVVEAVLLQRKHGLFTGGFLARTPLGTYFDVAAFLMLVALVNATFVAPLCGIALNVGRGLRLKRRALLFVAFAAGALPLLAANFLMYQVWAYLGDAFDFTVMFNLTGRRLSEMFAVAAPLVTRPVGLGLLLAAAGIAATWALHRTEDGPTPQIAVPSLGYVAKVSAAMVILTGIIVAGICLSSESMTFGLRRIPAGSLTVSLLHQATDFDMDGHGLLRDPRDTAPFDPNVHPYALEIAGNGIDENGLAGDLPANRAQFQEAPAPTAQWTARPTVILFVLESFRADAVGATYEGRSVTPVLNGLARRGVQVDSAWSHNGFTKHSRFHILTGSMTDRGGTSLLDDFKRQGYEVAYFSAQNDSAFGEPQIDYRSVDTYYDARQDVARRYSAYTTPGSLAVPFNVLEERIGEFLNARRSPKPLFLYVNFHDTHYPYTHAHVQNLLGVDLLDPAQLSPARRRELWRTYLNTAANVDRAIGRVIDAVTTSVRARPGVVVISDHGEGLFEGGFLGHGHALNAVQTQIPLVISGLPLRIETPFGQSGLRDAINDALVRGDLQNPPRVEAREGRRVFQYLGTLEHPGQIGWLSQDGVFTYDFRTNEVGLWDSTLRPADLSGEPRRLFQDLAYTWESMQLALTRAGRPDETLSAR